MFFITEPELLRLEKMMILVPNFAPRSCGVRVCEGKELPGSVPYDEMIRNTMIYIRNPAFRQRLNDYLNERKERAMNYRGARHQSLFLRELQKRENPTAAMLCALYLLTADCRLWSRVRQNVHASDIQFAEMRTGDISPEAYALFAAAKDLYCGTRHITIRDLADKEIISPQLFGILCEAMTLRRYGIAAYAAADRRKRDE